MAEIRIPDLGDFDEVEVVELHVAEGDRIEEGDPILTLETEKAAMDVPSPFAGVVEKISVGPGDSVSQGDLISIVSSESKPNEEDESNTEEKETEQAIQESEDTSESSKFKHDYDLIVVGAGPGGYAAAFRASDLGLKVGLVERNSDLGGVCLNVGCIPSKAFLHAAKILDDSKEAEVSGIVFKEPEINLSKMKEWKNNIIGGLTGGLSGLAQQRGVDVVHGTAKFSSKNEIEVNHEIDSQRISSDQFIIAVGSEPAELSFLPDDPRIIDSTGALEPDQIPKNILIIGGGIIGLEMATIYSALGSEVTIVELTKQLMPGTDPDLVRPLERILNKKCKKIMKSSQVISASASDEGISISFKQDGEESSEMFQNVLVAVGRKSNGSLLGLNEIGVNVDERGIIGVDKQECKAKGLDYGKGIFPWSASGRSLTIGRNEGMTKLIFNNSTKKIVGGGIVGPNAGDLISEIALAIEMDCDVSDIALTVHPHPTLSETVGMAAEVFEGTVTDLYVKPRN